MERNSLYLPQMDMTACVTSWVTEAHLERGWAAEVCVSVGRSTRIRTGQLRNRRLIPGRFRDVSDLQALGPTHHLM